MRGAEIVSLRNLGRIGRITNILKFPKLSKFPINTIKRQRPYHKKLLVVVGLVLKDSKCSVELFCEYCTHNLVRECHLR